MISLGVCVCVVCIAICVIRRVKRDPHIRVSSRFWYCISWPGCVAYGQGVGAE